MNGMAKTIAGGIAGTLAMTVVGLYVAPLMGMPAMNPAVMLADAMGGMLLAGWAGHLMIGVVLAVIYAQFARSLIPGPVVVRGMIFSIAPWLMAQMMVMPMMGMPLFSGSVMLASGSLIGHIVYGAVMAAVIGDAQAAKA